MSCPVPTKPRVRRTQRYRILWGGQEQAKRLSTVVAGYPLYYSFIGSGAWVIPINADAINWLNPGSI